MSGEVVKRIRKARREFSGFPDLQALTSTAMAILSFRRMIPFVHIAAVHLNLQENFRNLQFILRSKKPFAAEDFASYSAESPSDFISLVPRNPEKKDPGNQSLMHVRY